MSEEPPKLKTEEGNMIPEDAGPLDYQPTPTPTPETVIVEKVPEPEPVVPEVKAPEVVATGQEQVAAPTTVPEVLPPTKEERDRHFESVEKETEERLEAAKPSHGIFGRLKAGIERTGIKLAHAPAAEVFKQMYEWRSERAARAEAKFENRKTEVAKAEAAIANLDESIAKAKTLGGFTAAVATKMDRERATLLHNAEKAKTRFNKTHVTLEHRNGKKVYWEHKENDLAEKIVNQIDQKLQPSRDIFEDLVAQNEQAKQGIDRLKQLKETGQTGLKELRAKLKNNPSADEKAETKTKLKAVEDLLGRIDEKYNTYTKEQARIGAKMNRANLYIGQWDVMRNEQLRTTSKDRRHFDPGAQTQEERMANREHRFSHAPKPGEQVAVTEVIMGAPNGQTETAYETPTAQNDNRTEGRQEQPEPPEPTDPGGASGPTSLEAEVAEVESAQALKMDVDTYLKKWNEKFAKNDQDKIDTKEFADTYQLKQSEALPIKTIEDAIITKLTKGETGWKLRLLKQGIETDLEALHKEFKNEQLEQAA